MTIVNPLPPASTDADAPVAGHDPIQRDPIQLAIWRNRFLAGIFVLLLLAIGAIAARVVLPIMVALLFSLMLAPAVRFLTTWRMPRSLASLIVLGVAIAAGGLLLNALARPAIDWFAQAPKVIEQVAHQMHSLWRPLADASKATEKITHSRRASVHRDSIPAVVRVRTRPAAVSAGEDAPGRLVPSVA